MRLEVWSDIACSWCYVGKRRLEAALAQFEHAGEVEVVWRSFELDPAAPVTATPGRSSTEVLAELRGISLEHAAALQQRMADLAAEDGLDFHFEHMKLGSTFDAHRLLHLAQEYGLQGVLKERLLRGYFTAGAVISDHATLHGLAAEVGLPEAEVANVLAGDHFADAVRADEQTAAGFGVRAVPFFVIDREIGAAGALPVEEMLGFLRQGWTARPRVPIVVSGEVCGPDGC